MEAQLNLVRVSEGMAKDVLRNEKDAILASSRWTSSKDARKQVEDYVEDYHPGDLPDVKVVTSHIAGSLCSG